MSKEVKRLCPFSLPFARKVIGKIEVSSPLPIQQVEIGFNCIGDKCAWWDEDIKKCIAHKWGGW